MAAAVALANIDDLRAARTCCGNVRENEPRLRARCSTSLRDIPIVGDVRGAGYFHAIELVKDKETKETFTDEESESLLRGFLSGAAVRRGPDLPRRRPRRPGDPARAAADRRARAVRGDRRHPAPGARGGVGEAQPGEPWAPMLLRPRPHRATSTSASWRARPASTRPSAGCTSPSCADPTPWLSGGELLLTTGHAARPRHEQRAFVERLADHGLAGLGFGVGFAHAEVPAGDVRGGRGARLPALRGALRGAVHRGHREGVLAPRQRAVRGAAAGDLRPRAAGADRASASAGSTAWSRRWRRWSAARRSSSTAAARCSRERTVRRALAPRCVAATRRRAARARAARGERARLRAARAAGTAARSRCPSCDAAGDADGAAAAGVAGRGQGRAAGWASSTG